MRTIIALLIFVAACAATPAQSAASSAPVCHSSLGQSSQSPAGAHEVAAALDKLRPLLTDKQRAELDRPLSSATAIRWSNLPIGIVPRSGLRLGDLDDKQAMAARAVFTAALSPCGLTMLDEVRLADDSLVPFDKRPIGWGGGNYYLSVLGDSSSKAPWMLQVGGHHLAYNFTFNGREAGATPLFAGTEPIRFESRGRQVEPLDAQSHAMSRLAGAIAPQAKAHLSGTFTDVVKGVVVTDVPGGMPTGGTDTGFPQSYPGGDVDRGIQVSALSPQQRDLVRAAIVSFAQLPDSAISGSLLAGYLAPAALDQTFVGFAGSPDLGTQGSYVRIDGPRVWIELVVQRAIAQPDQLHYHSLWRDKQSDYGGELKR
jgi:hypothetical protein